MPPIPPHYGKLMALYKEQERQGKRGTAHNRAHMVGTAEAAEEYALFKGASPEMAFFVGMVHDMVRVPYEEEDISDRLTAQYLYWMGGESRELVDKALAQKHWPLYQEALSALPFNKEEFITAAEVVLANGNGVGKIVETAEKWAGEKGALLLALMYGDKAVEGLGFRVMARRFAFTMERLSRGDLSYLGTSRDVWEKALAMESLIRIRWRKNRDDYPRDALFTKALGKAVEEELIYKLLLAELFEREGWQSEWGLWQWGRHGERPFPRSAKPAVEERVKKELRERALTAEDLEGYRGLWRKVGEVAWWMAQLELGRLEPFPTLPLPVVDGLPLEELKAEVKRYASFHPLVEEGRVVKSE